jgi:hypothetical protein
MAWNAQALAVEVMGEFIDAQGRLVDRARSWGWKAHSLYVLRHAQAKKRWSLRALRKRLHGRAAVACKNAKCGVRFVPYRGDTRYCSVLCRVRHLSLAAYHRRRALSEVKRACRQCGALIARRHRDAMYCSVRCNRRAVRKRTP